MVIALKHVPFDPRLTPRKAPRQGRSRTTVDAILVAARRVLLEEGVETATTNRIAEVAGVSIGSLYQYFPSKESLIAALYQQVRAAKLAAIADALAATAGRDVAEVADAIARALVEAYAEAPELEKLMADAAVRIGAQRKVADIDASMTTLLGGLLQRASAGGDDARRGMRAFLLARSVDGAVRAVALEHPAWLREAGFVEEVAAMVRGHLTAMSRA